MSLATPVIRNEKERVYPTLVIPVKTGIQLGRAIATIAKDWEMAYSTPVIPAKAGIQKGRATPNAAIDWIPDRAADYLRDIPAAGAAACPG